MMLVFLEIPSVSFAGVTVISDLGICIFSERRGAASLRDFCTLCRNRRMAERGLETRGQGFLSCARLVA